jgi:hypothetical protein
MGTQGSDQQSMTHSRFCSLPYFLWPLHTHKTHRLYLVEGGMAVEGVEKPSMHVWKVLKNEVFMECSKMGKMKVRNCTEILHRKVRVGSLGLASVTCALCSWPQALPLGTRWARGLGFEAMPWLCLGDSRAALVALGSALGDSLLLCPRALRPCLSFALVTCTLRLLPRL